MGFDRSYPSPIPHINNYAWLTVDQLAAIGSVAAAWSWLDLSIEGLLATLIQSDEMLAQALTEDLSPDNRLKALRRLVTTWERMAHMSPDHRSALKEVREIASWVAKNKKRRNQIVHWIWLRNDDERMFGWKHHIMPDHETERPNRELTKAEIFEFSAEIGAIAGRAASAELMVRSLPPFPRPPHGTPESPAIASLLGSYRLRT